jgi:hypothetical protein
VDQASTDVQTETQKPQNQKNNENGPKHIETSVLIREHTNMNLVPRPLESSFARTEQEAK